MSRQIVTLLKGVGILLIITHNYMHWLPDCVAENEYTFNIERINQLADYLANGGPHIILNFLSHFGHYGVAIFLFLSGYGLTRKYETPLQTTDTKTIQTGEPKQIALFRFIGNHALKLWKLMVPAVLLFVAIEMYLGTWNRPWSRLLPLLGFYSNLQPERDLILGPWWWFGLMMQFYVIWRLLIYRSGKLTLYITIAICLLTQIAAAWIERGNLASDSTLTNYLHYNFPCSMLAFGLGVAHARYNLDWLRQWWSPLVGLSLIIVGAFNAGIWCISSVGIIMIVVTFATNFKVRLHSSHIRYITPHHTLVFFGKISAWLFAIHPIVRTYAIKMAKNNDDTYVYLSILIYLAGSVFLAWLFTHATKKRLSDTINNPKQSYEI